jgi:hypothetical protein
MSIKIVTKIQYNSVSHRARGGHGGNCCLPVVMSLPANRVLLGDLCELCERHIDMSMKTYVSYFSSESFAVSARDTGLIHEGISEGQARKAAEIPISAP